MQAFGRLTARLGKGKRRRDRDGEGGEESLDAAAARALADDEEEALEEARASGLLSSASASASAAHVNNGPGLRAALTDIRQDTSLAWIQRLEVVSAETLESSLPTGVGDDLKVELAFYGQALAAVSAARAELERLGVPHRRPADYFAEMLKSDAHMAKVKNKMVVEAKRVGAVEHRRREKEAHVFNKQVQGERLKDKAADKRQSLDAVKNWRANKDARPDLSSERDLDSLFKGGGGGGALRGGKPGGSGGKPAGADRGKPNFRRQNKDNKYGHGGMPRRITKENSQESSADMRGFSVKRMKANPSAAATSGKGRGGKGSGSKGGGGKGATRPGKWARGRGSGSRSAGR